MRPAIGTRVRLLPNVGVPSWIAREGLVVAHHPDGIAFQVQITQHEAITCDPVNVQPLAGATRTGEG